MTMLYGLYGQYCNDNARMDSINLNEFSVVSVRVKICCNIMLRIFELWLNNRHTEIGIVKSIPNTNNRFSCLSVDPVQICQKWRGVFSLQMESLKSKRTFKFD